VSQQIFTAAPWPKPKTKDFSLSDAHNKTVGRGIAWHGMVVVVVGQMGKENILENSRTEIATTKNEHP
jgi:hypothetical protein